MLKKKKVVSMVLALALAVGTVTPCLAASGESNGKSKLPSGESPYTSSSVSSWTDESVLTGAWSLDWAKAKINDSAVTVKDGTVQLDWTADEMERQVEVQYLLDEENEPEEDTAPSEEAEPEAAV